MLEHLKLLARIEILQKNVAEDFDFLSDINILKAFDLPISTKLEDVHEGTLPHKLLAGRNTRPSTDLWNILMDFSKSSYAEEPAYMAAEIYFEVLSDMPDIVFTPDTGENLAKGVPVGAPWMDDELLDASLSYSEKVTKEHKEPEEAYAEVSADHPRVGFGGVGQDGSTASDVNQDFEWFWLGVEKRELQIPDIPIPGREGQWTIKTWMETFKESLSMMMGDISKAIVEPGKYPPRDDTHPDDAMPNITGGMADVQGGTFLSKGAFGSTEAAIEAIEKDHGDSVEVKETREDGDMVVVCEEHEKEWYITHEGRVYEYWHPSPEALQKMGDKDCKT